MTAAKYLQVFSLTIAGLLVGLDRDLLWAQRSPADNHVAYYQQLLKRNPQNAKAYLALGDAFIRKARETGDTSYFNRAEDALKRSLELVPENGGALRHLAYVFYSRHEFAPAAVFARKAVEMNSSDSDSYGVLGDALLEIGQYPEAQAAYAYMMELDESLFSYSRRAGFKSAIGEVDGAIADLERAIAIGKATRQPGGKHRVDGMAAWRGIFLARKFAGGGSELPPVDGKLSKLLPRAGRHGASARGAKKLRRSDCALSKSVGDLADARVRRRAR